MTDQQAWMDSIRSNPKDDTVRLAYADQLDESGDHDHARLIRLQCAYEEQRDPDRRPEASEENDSQQNALEEELNSDWATKTIKRLKMDCMSKGIGFNCSCDPCLSCILISRGFPYSLKTSWDTFSRYSDKILTSAPITRIELTDEPPTRLLDRAAPWPRPLLTTGGFRETRRFEWIVYLGGESGENDQPLVRDRIVRYQLDHSVSPREIVAARNNASQDPWEFALERAEYEVQKSLRPAVILANIPQWKQVTEWVGPWNSGVTLDREQWAAVDRDIVMATRERLRDWPNLERDNP